MKYHFELTLVVRKQTTSSPVVDKQVLWETSSIDVVQGETWVELFGQFLIVLAAVHKRVLEEIKRETGRVLYDDDIPF